MEKYRFTSEKFTVTLKENGEEKSLPVFIALVCDGRDPRVYGCGYTVSPL